MDPTAILAAAAAALGPGAPASAAQDDTYYVKVKPALSLVARPKVDRFAPFRYTTSGRLTLNGAPASQGCRGSVMLRVLKGSRTVVKGRTRIQPDCTYRKPLTVRTGKLRGETSGTLRISARFGGNDVLQPDQAPNRKVRFGR